MPAIFPPGDIAWRNAKPHSAWREFKFVLNQVTRIIEPNMTLVEMLTNWNALSESLAESPRARTSQLSDYFEYLKTS